MSAVSKDNKIVNEKIVENATCTFCGCCCDDTCCDARGVMHEYIMAIFLGKSENQEGGGMLIVKVGGN